MSGVSDRFGRRGKAAALLLVAAYAALQLAGPTAASAATALNTHFAVGHGEYPDIAVARDGTAHVVWVHKDASGKDTQIQYCRVPRGKRACASTHTFTLAGEQTGERPYVFLAAPAQVLILAHRCCFDSTQSPVDNQTLLLRSADGGRTFAAPLLIGTHNQQGDARLGPHGTVYTINDIATEGVSVQRNALDGSAMPVNDERANLGGDEYGGSLATLADGSVLAAHWDSFGGPRTAHVSRFSGSGDPNAAASWSTAFTAPGQETQLANGPKGVYLFTMDNELLPRFQVRHWTGSAFTPAAFITPTGQDNIFPSFWEDAGGRVSVAYSDKTRTLLYRASDLRGWSTALNLRVTSAYHLRGATAADGGGFVAYDTNAGTGVVSLVPIPVRRIVTETVTATAVSGRIAPSAYHQPVVLQRLVAGTWTTIATTYTNTKLLYAFGLPRGKLTLRVVAPALEGYAAAAGKVFAHG